MALVLYTFRWNDMIVWIFTSHHCLVYPVLHYYAFVHVSLIWLAHFLSPDYFSAGNSLGIFNLFYVSPWRSANARNVRLYYPFWQYIYIFIFRFVSLHCLRSTLRLFLLLVNIFYFDLYLNTAYAAHYLFYFVKTVISLALIDMMFVNSQELHRGRR